MQFCIADVYPKRWDVSLIENISAGGIKFSAPNDLKLKDKIIQLRLTIPELSPQLVELEALVVDVKTNFDSIYSDIRVKFINLTEDNKADLLIIEKMIEKLKSKNPPKDPDNKKI
jgi:hypothetical protein